jgi:hypothetical protein
MVASALLMDSESWFAVDVFEPKTTTTPNRAAINAEREV